MKKWTQEEIESFKASADCFQWVVDNTEESAGHVLSFQTGERLSECEIETLIEFENIMEVA